MGAPQNLPNFKAFRSENPKSFTCFSQDSPQNFAEISKRYPKEISEHGLSTSESSPTNESSNKAKEMSSFARNFEETTQNKQAESLLIDVKPKRKIFQNEQEKKKYIDGFVQKKKTELCKNWEMNGSCKYGENCSFAHGLHELKTKTHLNSNYKQKPCKQYLMKGVCSYGNRCQYLHREIKYYPEHKDFLLKAQKKTGLSMKTLVNFKSEVKELRKMETEYEKVKDVEKLLCGTHKENRRLPIFSLITRL